MITRRHEGPIHLFLTDQVPAYLTGWTLVEAPEYLLLCDTGLGLASMEPVKEVLKDIRGGRPLYVFNTHAHWDHVGGNGAFPDARLLASPLTIKALKEHYEEERLANRGWMDREAPLVLPEPFPQLPFQLPGEGVIFPSPGHTRDSLSFYLPSQGLLLAGDNLERPLIYVEDSDLEGYIRTLEGYLALRPRRIIASHSPDLACRDIEEALSYLQALKDGGPVKLKDPGQARVHEENLRFLKKV